jgi:hypothetical protein
VENNLHNSSQVPLVPVELFNRVVDRKEPASVVSSLEVVMRLAIVGPALFLAAAVAVTATPLLNDPEITIDSGCCSIPISTGINTVQPTGAETVTYDFFNDTNNIVTGFRFATTINTGLSSQAAASFTCADPGGYFLNCTTTYTSSTGNLLYVFSGVNPADGDESGSDTEVGEQEGIPPAGHFIITLQGWIPDAMSAGQTLYSGTPVLDDTFTQTPEPAVALTLGTGLLLLAAIWRRRRTVQ